MTQDEKIYSIMASVTKKNVEYLKENRDVIGLWDSLKRIEIVFLIEEQFNISLQPEEIAEFNTIQNIIDFLSK